MTLSSIINPDKPKERTSIVTLSFPYQNSIKTIKYDLKTSDSGIIKTFSIGISDGSGSYYAFFGVVGNVGPLNESAKQLDEDVIFCGLTQDKESVAWQSHGLYFKLKVDGSLDLIRISDEDEAVLKISGSHKLTRIIDTKVELKNCVFSGPGTINASELVLSGVIYMPELDIRTRLLTLQTTDFRLKNQTHCKHTVLKTKSGQSVTIKSDFGTTGTFAICEEGVDKKNIARVMLEHFGPLMDYNLEALPQSNYKISLQAKIRADKGFGFYTPNASIISEANNQDSLPEIMASSSMLAVYATYFDASCMVVSAAKADVWTPRGLHIGKLVIDQSRRVFSTFYSHANATTSHLLHGIRVIAFNFLGQDSRLNLEQIQIARHLLSMPVATPNNSKWDITGPVTIIGALHNRGTLKAGSLKLHSVGTSVVEAGKIILASDCELLNGEIHFKIHSASVRFLYFREILKFDFCNSDKAGFKVGGKLSGDTKITVTGCIFNVNEKSVDVQPKFEGFKSSMFQQFISGATEQLLELQNYRAPIVGMPFLFGIQIPEVRPSTAVTRCPHYVPQDINILAHALGFLEKTNNFVGAQQWFPTELSTDIDTVLTVTREHPLDAIVTSPQVLIAAAGGSHIMSTANGAYVPPINSVQNLSNHSYNQQTTTVHDVRQQLKADAQPDIYFILSDRFRDNNFDNKKFYQDMIEDVVVIDADNRLSKPKPQTVFSITPDLLLERVVEDCQKSLQRDRISTTGRKMDLAYLQDLHRNACKYIAENDFKGDEFAQDLTLAASGKHPSPPVKPMLYYQAMMNDQGLEVLCPYLYIPVSLINEVRASHGSLLNQEVLFLLPDDLTPDEILNLKFICDRPAMKMALIGFYEANSAAKEYLHKRAMEMREKQRSQVLALSNIEASAANTDLATTNGGDLVLDADDTSNFVNWGGSVRANQVIALSSTGFNISVDMTTTDSLLVSLLDDIRIRSVVERQYRGNMHNFDDKVVKQARIHASNISQILSAKKVVFIGVQTDVGVATEISAIAGILDESLELVHQRVQFFNERRKNGYIAQRHIAQHTSTHKADTISMISNLAILLAAPQIEARTLELRSDAQVVVTDVQQSSSYEEHITAKSSSILGSKTKTSDVSANVVNSVGANFKVNLLKIFGAGGVVLKNVSSQATHNVLSSPDGEISILVGRNYSASVSQHTKKNTVWWKSETETRQQQTYTIPFMSGVIEVDAKELHLEQVRHKTMDYIANIRHNQNNIRIHNLDEYYDIQTKELEGPGPGLAALVAIATTILTQGAASGLAESIFGTNAGAEAIAATATSAGVAAIPASTAHVAISAGFSSLFAQSSVALLSNNGNPIAAVKSLANEGTIKSLAVAMITAGLIDKACAALNLATVENIKLLEDHLKLNIAKTSVGASINMAVNDADPVEAIAGALVQATINTVTSTMLAQEVITKVEHTVLQTAIGAVQGVVGQDGALFGALTSLVGAVLPDMIKEEETATIRTASANTQTDGIAFGDVDGSETRRVSEDEIVDQEDDSFSPVGPIVEQPTPSAKNKIVVRTRADEEAALARNTASSDAKPKKPSKATTRADGFDDLLEPRAADLGSSAGLMSSVDDFMRDPIRSYAYRSSPRSTKNTAYYVGGRASAYVASAVLGTVDLFSSNDPHLRTGEYQEFSLDDSKHLDGIVEVLREIPKHGLVPIWDVYRNNYNAKMRQAAFYERNGKPVKAGFISGKAQGDVAMDVVGLAGLGYGGFRVGNFVTRQSSKAYHIMSHGVPRGAATNSIVDALVAPLDLTATRLGKSGFLPIFDSGMRGRVGLLHEVYNDHSAAWFGRTSGSYMVNGPGGTINLVFSQEATATNLGYTFNFRLINNQFPPNTMVVDFMKSDRLKSMLRTNNLDCAEIAAELLSVSGGKGKIITIESTLGRYGEINIAELDPATHTVKVERYQYHSVFRDDKYVYDPRLSNNPIARGDYQRIVKKLNNDGVRIYEGDPQSPVIVEKRGKLTIKAGRL